MSPLSQPELKKRIALLPAHPPRTVALQERIQIGVGFHNKWYRSQKEHWLGWIVVKEYNAYLNDVPLASITAKRRWGGLGCIPMMFWLAEVAGIQDSHLAKAEEAAVAAAGECPHDCSRHGKIMRQVFPWVQIEKALLEMPSASVSDTLRAAKIAYTQLETLKPARKRLRLQAEEKGFPYDEA